MSSSRVNCTKSPINAQSNNPFSNNYEEGDTRMLRLCSIMKGDIIICSTDTDLLVIALINHTQLKLGERNIVIHFGKAGEEFVYCWISQFVKVVSSSLTYSLLTTRNIYLSKIIGVMHFITGCDVLWFLCGFTKGYCFKTFNKHSNVICPELADDAEKIVEGKQSELNMLIITLLHLWIRYYQKFLSNFRSGRRSNEVFQ